MLHFWTWRSRAFALVNPRSQSRCGCYLIGLFALVSIAGDYAGDRTALGLTLPADSAAPAQPTPAAPLATAPPALKTWLAQATAAANSKNLPALMQLYGDNFTHADGLTRPTLEQAVAKLWQQYPNLTYRTELTSFQPAGDGYQFETLTSMTGSQTIKGRTLKFAAKLQSRQQLVGQKIVSQETLTEHNIISSGEKPPTLKVLLPEQVQVGQEYSFDAIVQEPLENDLLLGAALDEAVNSETLLSSPKVDLVPLLSGGLFKVGRAPNSPTQQWLSAVVVRQSGITIATQRLRVVARASGTAK